MTNLSEEWGARPRIVVMGCGGIGGIVAAHLVEAGHDAIAVSTNARIEAAVNGKGFELRGDGSPRTIPGRITSAFPDGPIDLVILATQPPQVEEAARLAASALAPNGAMLVLQNGLCEARVAAIVGEERTFGGVVGWGAWMSEPGIYERTSEGGFTIGRLDGKSDPRLDRLARLLEPIGAVEITSNLRGKRWSKLAINSAISSLGTLGGDRLGALLQYRFARRLAIDVMTEVVEVARAEKVKLEKVAGTVDLDWVALTADEKTASGSPGLVAKHALLLAVGFRFRRMRSSMLSALERGRTPAVEFLNGEVVALGKKHGIPTPVNEAIVDLIWKAARKEVEMGVPLIRGLYESTGPRDR